jgi:hypothetical protein
MSNVGQANPFSDASEYNTLDFVIARATEKMQTVSIVAVKAVDTVKLTVDVQVLVNLVTGANISVPHGVIAARPYFRAQGGTSGIILDPVASDIGVMVFASRDSSAVIAAKGLANPGSQRRFSWSDGVYFGGILNAAPTQYLKFASGGVTLLSPTAVNIQSPANTVTGPATVTGATTLQATLAVTGTSTLTGAVSTPGGITVGSPTGGTAAPGTINAAGLFVNGVPVSTGGGGSGTVTSVGISTGGVGVVVGGGPITTAGTLIVDLSSTAYAALALAVTALQSISIATGTGLTGGPLTASGTTVALSAATIAALLPASPVQGDIVYYNGAAWANLAPGTAGNVLTTGGAGANPSWAPGGGGSTPVPGTIPDLVFWFDGNAPLMTTGAHLESLQNLCPWMPAYSPFLTGGAKGATRSATTLNSKNLMTFPGSADAAYLMPGAGPIMPEFTGFVVFNAGAASTMSFCCGASSASLEFDYTSGGALNLTASFVAGIGNSTTTVAPGTAFQGNATYDGATGNYAFRISQAAAGSGTNSQSITSGSGGIGFDPQINGQYLNGMLAELIIYNRVLSPTEIANVEAYLHTKWGV